MSGHVKGCASVIQNLYPAALYVHCANQSLNLAIATTCKIPAIRNCIGSMKETVNLFRMSTKAGTLLKNLILESFPNSKQVKLLKFCETRWVEHLESLSLFNDLFPLICTALEELDIENLRSDLSKPHALLTAIQSPQFVIAMAILKPIFALSKHISLCLQQIDCDLSSCVAYANNLYAEISEMRKDSEQSFKLIFESVKTIAAELDLEIKIPRLAKRQTNRDNYEGEPEEYYRRSIYIPFLDHFLDQINERFLKHRELLSKIENILPNKCVNLDVIEMQETVRVLEKQWSADVEDPDDFVAEFRMWKRNWLNQSKRSKTFLDALNCCDAKIFKTVHRFLKIGATIPISVASSERSFSSLRRLKTYLRNKTGEARLNGMALLNIHRDIDVMEEEILNVMAQNKRRLDFNL
ncbi:52 kDa repressor of the inhibitor of the protein kinase-like [Bactrocera neohumeralis]|uniref:52 kDa repressor of the inhibitor of the protein kinase-like n=1 Tax=Bactrocera neohumeralis TaxID=98809 RepID=UPI0021655F88|nr:52 kDa repressor of the inhibitor of the protein kinase-like [Bactrocera neohumeralis]